MRHRKELRSETKLIKKIYLVRHGHVAFEDNITRCIGRTDLPLSWAGIEEAETLNKYFEDLELTRVFSSPLLRAKETAEIIGGTNSTLEIIDDLQEMDMGAWENQPLKSIKKDLTTEPEGGETRVQALSRMKRAMNQVAQTYGEEACVVVSHASMITTFIADLLGIPLEISRSLPQSYGSVSELVWDGSKFLVKSVGQMPEKFPSLAKVEKIAKHYGMPENVYRHGQAVAELAVLIGLKINSFTEAEGSKAAIDSGLLQAAAILHDIAKGSKFHVEDGANILRREGYPAVALLIEAQDNLRDPLTLNEESLLFYADKRNMHDRLVDIEERFAGAKAKIEADGSARAALEGYYRRLRAAYIVHQMIENRLGPEALRQIDTDLEERSDG